MLRQISFCFKREMAVSTVVGSKVSVCPQMLLQHAGLLTPDATQLTDVLAPASASDVLVVLITLEASFGEAELVAFIFLRGALF